MGGGGGGSWAGVWGGWVGSGWGVRVDVIKELKFLGKFNKRIFFFWGGGVGRGGGGLGLGGGRVGVGGLGWM